jgi:hypothetical protein
MDGSNNDGNYGTQHNDNNLLLFILNPLHYEEEKEGNFS